MFWEENVFLLAQKILEFSPEMYKKINKQINKQRDERNERRRGEEDKESCIRRKLSKAR